MIKLQASLPLLLTSTFFRGQLYAPCMRRVRGSSIAQSQDNGNVEAHHWSPQSILLKEAYVAVWKEIMSTIWRWVMLSKWININTHAIEWEDLDCNAVPWRWWSTWRSRHSWICKQYRSPKQYLMKNLTNWLLGEERGFRGLHRIPDACAQQSLSRFGQLARKGQAPEKTIPCIAQIESPWQVVA